MHEAKHEYSIIESHLCSFSKVWDALSLLGFHASKMGAIEEIALRVILVERKQSPKIVIGFLSTMWEI